MALPVARTPASHATIDAVARRARVSIATVSRALNGSGAVATATLERVRRAADELGYVPNEQARHLRRGRTQAIGFLVPNIADPSYAAILQALTRTMCRLGSTVIAFDAQGDADLEAQALEVFLRSRVAGLALARTPALPAEAAARLAERDIPVVYFDDRPENTTASSVTLADRAGAQQLVSHLIQLGHRRIGLVSGRLDGSSGRDRRDGYLDALHEHGIGSDPDLIRGFDWGLEAGRTATAELLALSHPPSAILTVDPLAPVGALAAIRAAGLDVPRDISLVNFSDAPHLRYLDPPITCLAGAEEETAVAIADILLSDTQIPRAIQVELTLEPRDSHGPPPRTTPTPRRGRRQTARPV
jgi:LacI family transcriptional regulator